MIHKSKWKRQYKEDPETAFSGNGSINTLKYEEVYLCEYESFDEAHKNIKKFIEIVYNKKGSIHLSGMSHLKNLKS